MYVILACHLLKYIAMHLKTILAVTLSSIKGVPEVHVSKDGVCCKIVSSCEV